MSRERVDEVRAILLSRVNERYSDIGLGVIVSEFGEGVRVILLKPVTRGVYPVAHTSCSSLEGKLEDIVHGLWLNLMRRSKDEIRELRARLKKSTKELKY